MSPCLSRSSFAAIAIYAVTGCLVPTADEAPPAWPEVPVFEGTVHAIEVLDVQPVPGAPGIHIPHGTTILGRDPQWRIALDVTRVRVGPPGLAGARAFAVHSPSQVFGEAGDEAVGGRWLFRLAGVELSAEPLPDAAPEDRLPRIERRASEVGPSEAAFLCGRRAAVEVFLGDDRIGRAAFSPIDALSWVEVRSEPPLALEAVSWSPSRIEKRRRSGDLSARSIWRADGERPLFRIDGEFRNSGSAPVEIRISARVAANVGWVNKFVPHADDLAAVEGGRAIFRDALRPHLQVEAVMEPAADRIDIDPAGPAPAARTAVLEKTLRIPPGGSASIAIVLRGSDRPEELSALPIGAMPEPIDRLLAGAAFLECPSPILSELVRACEAWPAANIRDLPFGAPWGLDGMKNERLPVITASPDYHGIFANDCIQTLWELGLLGPGLHAAARNSVETMFRFGPKESVEWWTGDGRVWSFPHPLGDTPQIVLGACWHILWTGDRDLARRWWPDIRRCLAVLDANDSDGDSLEDRPNTPYPEQPDPGPFNHEMLYVQCFWRQAHAKAADAAEMLGLEEAEALRAKAGRIRRSIEERFSTPYGLAVWLDRDHRPHPHIGHEAIIAAAAGDVGDAKARQVVETAMRPPVWTDDGPLRAEPGKGVAAGGHVWTFMRWKLVHALFRLGDADRAVELAERWAAQEKARLWQAPEGFPTITGTTGKGYTWTAGRALRAVAIGLSGLDLDGKGVAFSPRLPSRWGRYALRSIPVHGARIDLEVRRGPAEVRVNGEPRPVAAVRYEEIEPGVTVKVAISVP